MSSCRNPDPVPAHWHLLDVLDGVENGETLLEAADHLVLLFLHIGRWELVRAKVTVRGLSKPW